MIGLPPPGARFMLLSALGFALMAACVKLAALRGIPLLEIMLARCAVSLAISYAVVRRKRISPWGDNRRLLLARGLIGAAALICVYYAITVLPLAEATLLQYTHPVFTALLGALLLRETLQRSTAVCLLLSIGGLLVMVGPALLQAGAPRLPPLGVAIALAGAFGSAIAYIIVRRLSGSEDASVIILYFPLVALPVSALLLGRDAVLPDATGLLLLLLVGVFTQVGQWGLTHAMRHEMAGKAAAYSYVQVVFAAALGWWVFGELPTAATWIGGALIIAGALLNLGRR
ncbi:MAG: EamA family transporter [Halioglobus sp.]|nr:EamA family transporter [Halioglobus sp.]